MCRHSPPKLTSPCSMSFLRSCARCSPAFDLNPGSCLKTWRSDINWQSSNDKRTNLNSAPPKLTSPCSMSFLRSCARCSPAFDLNPGEQRAQERKNDIEHGEVN